MPTAFRIGFKQNFLCFNTSLFVTIISLHALHWNRYKCKCSAITCKLYVRLPTKKSWGNGRMRMAVGPNVFACAFRVKWQTLEIFSYTNSIHSSSYIEIRAFSWIWCPKISVCNSRISPIRLSCAIECASSNCFQLNICVDTGGIRIWLRPYAWQPYANEVFALISMSFDKCNIRADAPNTAKNDDPVPLVCQIDDGNSDKPNQVNSDVCRWYDEPSSCPMKMFGCNQCIGRFFRQNAWLPCASKTTDSWAQTWWIDTGDIHNGVCDTWLRALSIRWRPWSGDGSVNICIRTIRGDVDDAALMLQLGDSICDSICIQMVFHLQ